jgi:hypothetical protein
MASMKGFTLRVLTACALTGATLGHSSEVTDLQVKVAYLYNFARYVTWPSPTGGSDGFVIAILGTDPFGLELEDMLREKKVRGSPVVIRRASRLEEVGEAHILYISESEADELPRILKRLEGTPVLSVGELSRFAERGGMIQLRTEGNSVRLEINVGTADRARLKISSELLKLARIVDRRPKDRP